MRAKTISLSVLCPYCGTGYTFKTEENKRIWKNAGATDALHAACKKAKKNSEK